MAVKIQNKKKKVATQPMKASVEVQESQTEQKEVSTPIQQTTQVTQSSVDLGNFLATMTQMMNQQGEMMKMMDERMKKLEENQTKTVEGEVVEEPEVVTALNEDNVASYNRELEDGYTEVVNKVWKILYITAQAPVTRGMQDAAPMMEPVCERRRVGNQVVIDTKYFNSEDEAKMYIENLRRKGTILPGAKIISCYI